MAGRRAVTASSGGAVPPPEPGPVPGELLSGRRREVRDWRRLLWRGVTKRCPHCGGRKVYATWFRMYDRCPHCGLKFEREPGFFTGAYLINFAVAIMLLFVLCMGFVAVKAIDPDAGMKVPIAIGVGIGLFLPPLFYPFSRTIWSAIDVGMAPLEDAELAEAAAAVGRPSGTATAGPAAGTDTPETTGGGRA